MTKRRREEAAGQHTVRCAAEPSYASCIRALGMLGHGKDRCKFLTCISQGRVITPKTNCLAVTLP